LLRRLAVCAVFAARAARADEPGDTQLPLPRRSFVGVELDETDLRDAEARLRGLVVYRGWLAPSLGPDAAVSGIRIELPIRYKRDVGVGFGDANLLVVDGVVFDRGGVGIGLAAVLPTAAPTRLGDGSLELGPAAFGQIEPASWLQLAALARGFVAVTGGAAPQIRLKPSIVADVTDDFFVSSDAEMTLANSSSIPVNVKLGRRFGAVEITFGPELVVAGNDRGALTLDLEIDVLR